MQYPKVIRLQCKPCSTVNTRNKNGHTDLMVAAFDGHKDIVEVLINAGADVNAKYNDNLTALMIAEIRGHAEIVEMLNPTTSFLCKTLNINKIS